ncbi:T9SS type A sorting domain-containing protein [Pontibacter rugosus]
MGEHRTTYSQNFDGLPVSGSDIWESGGEYLPGWSVFRSKAANSLTANNGGSNTGGLYSYGSERSSDRALGSISSAVAGEFTYTVLLQNNTGRTIQAVDLSYIGEQWRISNSTAGQHVISFYYAVSSDKNSFTPSPSSDRNWTELPEMKFYGPKYKLPGTALNGNAADNRQLLQTSLPLEIPAGHYLMLRWKDADELEADHGLAVDDFSITWYPEQVLEPVPLPVELVKFKANTQGALVELKWQTASEQNSSHFTVERSTDGKNYESIGMVTGQGSSSSIMNYTFLDEAPVAGTSYYRLKQVDLDDSFSYSIVEAVTRSVAHMVNVHPTITSDVLLVNTDKKLQQAMIIDLMGKRHLITVLPHKLSRHTIPVSSLSKGTYILVLLDADGQRHSTKFIKM